MGPFTGTWQLAKLALRRDRVRIPVWIVAIAGSMILTVASFPEVYAGPAERQARAAVMASPATKAIIGPGYGLEDYTFGAMTANEMFPFIAIFVALMSVLLTVRHTRAEEASGSAELVRASVVGRHASAMAALIVVGLANILLAGITAVGVGSLGVESVDWQGSLLLGAALAAVGFVFMGIALVAAQITSYARAAAGIGGAAIALLYVVNGIGNLSGGAITWLSPFGWALSTQMYVNNYWWPLLPALALTIVCVVAGLALSTQRDVGGSMVQARPGPAQAKPRLATVWGIARRLQRVSFVWWAIGLALFGLMYGSLVNELERFIENVAFADALLATGAGAAAIDAFLATIMSIVAMIVAVYAILTVLRLRTEETAGRAEPLLAAAVPRTRWVASHVAIALAGSTVLLLLAGLGLGTSAAITSGNPELFGGVLSAALVNIPAVWLLIGLALALFGLLPRLSVVVWILLVYGMIVGMLGGLLGLPDWAYNISPFAQVPLVPAEDFAAWPLIVLTLIAAGLAAVGLIGFRRRNLDTP